MIARNRAYWDVDRTVDSFGLSKSASENYDFAKENSLTHVHDLCGAILNYFGVKPDATDEDIYKVLEVLGWRIEDEEHISQNI